MRTYQRNGVWYIDYSFNGKRVRKKVGTSKKMADLALNDIELRITKREFLGIAEQKKMLFDKLCDDYLDFSKANKASSSYRRDTISIKNLSKCFGTRMISEMTASDLERYKIERSKEVSMATVNRELSCIKHMFNKAVHWGYLTRNPLRDVQDFKEPPGRVRYLTDVEIEILLNSCFGHIKNIVTVALNTGMRKGEILNLRWQDVDLRNRLIIIRNAKNNESRTIPINETLHDMFRMLIPTTDGEYIFANKEGKPFGDVRTSFRNALRRAGIKDFRFHDLRHTFASKLVMRGVDIRTVQTLLGHKDIAMTMRYSHLSDSHLKEAVKKLEVGTKLAQETSTRMRGLAKP
jgi:integrase